MEPYIVNVSSIQDFMNCRWRWVAKWVLNRVPKEDARPLRFGKLLHGVFEDYFLTGDPMADVIKRWREKWIEAAQSTIDTIDLNSALDAVADLDSFAEPMCLWTDLYPIEKTLEVETPFEIESPISKGIFFRGRPDRVVTMWGKLFHVQNRSLAAGVNFALYAELSQRSLHEHVYAYALKHKYPDIPYGGTILNLLRKLKYRGVPTKKNPEGKILHPVNEILSQWQVSITERQNREMVELATGWASEMEKCEHEFKTDGLWPLPNERMNGGFYGNKIDPYFRVLQGEWELGDNRYFKDREDMYATVEVE